MPDSKAVKYAAPPVLLPAANGAKAVSGAKAANGAALHDPKANGHAGAAAAAGAAAGAGAAVLQHREHRAPEVCPPVCAVCGV